MQRKYNYLKYSKNLVLALMSLFNFFKNSSMFLNSYLLLN